MIQLAVAACLGAWAYVPADLDSDVAFKLSLGADSQFEMEFSDFGRSRGRWNRHRDNSFDLVEGSEKVATIKDCRDGSATVLINDRELSVTTYDAATYPTIIEDTTAIDAEVEAGPIRPVADPSQQHQCGARHPKLLDAGRRLGGWSAKARTIFDCHCCGPLAICDVETAREHHSQHADDRYFRR